MRTVLLLVFALFGVLMLASLLAAVLLLAAYVIGQARQWVLSRREMRRQLDDLIRERP